MSLIPLLRKVFTRKLLLLITLASSQFAFSHVFSKTELGLLSQILFPKEPSFALEIRSLEMTDEEKSLIQSMEVFAADDTYFITIKFNTEGDEIKVSLNFSSKEDASKNIKPNMDFIVKMKDHFHTTYTYFHDTKESDIFNMSSEAISQEGARFYKTMNAFAITKDLPKEEDTFKSLVQTEGGVNFSFSSHSDLAQTVIGACSE